MLKNRCRVSERYDSFGRIGKRVKRPCGTAAVMRENAPLPLPFQDGKTKEKRAQSRKTCPTVHTAQGKGRTEYADGQNAETEILKRRQKAERSF